MELTTLLTYLDQALAHLPGGTWHLYPWDGKSLEVVLEWQGAQISTTISRKELEQAVEPSCLFLDILPKMAGQLQEVIQTRGERPISIPQWPSTQEGGAA